MSYSSGFCSLSDDAVYQRVDCSAQQAPASRSIKDIGTKLVLIHFRRVGCAESIQDRLEFASAKSVWSLIAKLALFQKNGVRGNKVQCLHLTHDKRRSENQSASMALWFTIAGWK